MRSIVGHLAPNLYLTFQADAAAFLGGKMRKSVAGWARSSADRPPLDAAALFRWTNAATARRLE